MCYNVLQCVCSTLGCSAHSGTLGFLNVFCNVHERQCVSQCVACGFPNVFKTHWPSMCSNVPSMFFQCVFFAHWNTLKHIVVIVAQLHKNVPDYNVFQCVTMCLQWALKTHSMCFNVPPMFFQCVSCTLGYCPILNVQKTHWKNIGRHIDAHSMCF